jgi:hypothetical protein
VEVSIEALPGQLVQGLGCVDQILDLILEGIFFLIRIYIQGIAFLDRSERHINAEIMLQ